MTREEEINEELKVNHNIDGMQQGQFFDNGFYNGFHYGAEWADANPSDEMIKKVLCLAEEWSNGDRAEDIEFIKPVEKYIKEHWNDEKTD